MENFRVIRRNYGHWDVWTGNREEAQREFCIRGGPGKYYVRGDHSRRGDEIKRFKTVQACMSYICDELMFELIIAEGQDFDVIESWNV